MVRPYGRYGYKAGKGKWEEEISRPFRAPLIVEPKECLVAMASAPWEYRSHL